MRITVKKSKITYNKQQRVDKVLEIASKKANAGISHFVYYYDKLGFSVWELTEAVEKKSEGTVTGGTYGTGYVNFHIKVED